ncbi:MAG: selenium-binding family protein [Planctomycetales bacterium]|nr:selenium-binding family protein [Planctomycetales bacterium]
MRRRDFLVGTATGLTVSGLQIDRLFAQTETPHHHHDGCGLLYASPAEAMNSPSEKLAFLPAIHVGTKVDRPDYLAVVDVDPMSPTYSSVVSRLAMPHVGDELHHFGWNACSSCYGVEGKARQFLVLPGLASGRIHIIDVADPRQPKMHKVIEGEEIAARTDLSTPHTVHCLANGEIMISMLGNAAGDGPGGFLLLDDSFEIKGRWEREASGMKFNYDYWYQPRLNVMISSEWGAPKTVSQGFNPEEVSKGKYGRHIHLWDWQERRIRESFDLGEAGWIPLEVRFHHNPASADGFVGAALSSAIWRFHANDDNWTVDKVVQIEPVETAGWPFPVPGLITDLVLSLDDRWLYFSNWLHGDIRQYDISDPAHPRLTSQIWLGGVIGHENDTPHRKLTGGPQMLQLSLDGKRLYVTNSLYSPWDNQFYPDMAEQGSYLMQLDCDTERGGMTINNNLFVDFGAEPDGPARAHEIRFPDGDCTSDIWS